MTAFLTGLLLIMGILIAAAGLLLVIGVILMWTARASAQLGREFLLLRGTSVVLILSVVVGAVVGLSKALPGYTWPLVLGGLLATLLIPRVGDHHEQVKDEGEGDGGGAKRST